MSPAPPSACPASLRRLHAGDDVLDLPPRLVLFGFTLLPAGAFLDVARAVAAIREVHVFMLEPTHLDPGAAAARPTHRPADGSVRLRSSDATASLAHHPLLRSWGRLHRETALQLADVQAEGRPGEPAGRRGQPRPPVRPRSSVGCSTTSGPTGRPRPPWPTTPATTRCSSTPASGPPARSRSCATPLLHLLARPGSDLTEDDIVVLCPALDRFAPLIEAAFGRSAPATTTPPPDAASASARPRPADGTVRRPCGTGWPTAPSGPPIRC